MDQEQRLALLEALRTDELQRNRARLNYTWDAIEGSWIPGFEYTIWTESNANTLAIIQGDIGYEELPYDPDNEIYKGMCFKDQQQIIEEHAGETMYCEALGYNPCLGSECPLFIKEGYDMGDDVGPSRTPLCREFKIVFER